MSKKKRADRVDSREEEIGRIAVAMADALRGSAMVNTAEVARSVALFIAEPTSAVRFAKASVAMAECFENESRSHRPERAASDGSSRVRKIVGFNREARDISIEASVLGLRPGEWPAVLYVADEAFFFHARYRKASDVEPEAEGMAMIYESDDGAILRVVNC